MSGGRIFPVCPLIQSNINYPELFKATTRNQLMFKVYVETAREHGYYLPMTIVSSMASQSWKSADETVKAEYRRIAKEALRLKILREVSYPNILNFMEFIKTHIRIISCLLQLANGGTLRNYLESKWKDGKFEIPWINLISFAIEITCGLRFLHEKTYAIEIWRVVDIVDLKITSPYFNILSFYIKFF
ncbi:hypothetical protein C2G38_2039645 [Gigaspora rosea]|uniref:Protein kinase domain-containing protein n=1 Tax=Gigaspora rosea TaxID=44941 RepID=A0A397UY06_9GLOM|nr:hypothetical protein C2G38_2039645 [Gigaspora rosea]